MAQFNPKIKFGHRREVVEIEDKQGAKPMAYFFPYVEAEQRNLSDGIGHRSRWTSFIFGLKDTRSLAAEDQLHQPRLPAPVPQEEASGPPPRSRGEDSLRAFIGHVLQIVAKDLRVEWRSREILYTMSFFAILVVVIFSFAFARQGQPMHQVAGGILWVVIAFAGTIGLGRMFDRERENDTHRALLLCPASRAAIYLGKLVGVFLFISLTEAVIVPLLVVLFELTVVAPGLLLGLLILGTAGFSAVGALFAATLMQSRSRDVLLGILLFPIVTPVIVAGAKGTAALMAGPEEAAGGMVWLKLIFVFDLVFVSLSMWAFGPLARGE